MRRKKINRIKEAVFSPVGDQVITTQSGDLVIVQSHERFYRLMSFVQRIFRKKYFKWNRIGMIINEYGDFIESDLNGIQTLNVNSFDQDQYYILKINLTEEERIKCMNYLTLMQGRQYPLSSKIQLFVAMITGFKVTLDIIGYITPAGFIIQILKRTFLSLNYTPGKTSVSDLAEFFKIPESL